MIKRVFWSEWWEGAVFAWLYNGEGRRHAAGIELPQNWHVFVLIMCDDGLGDLRKSLRLFLFTGDSRNWNGLQAGWWVGIAGGSGARQSARA